jgi:hypothetical protein
MSELRDELGSIQLEGYGVVRSRRLLVDTIRTLERFVDAITVIGAHATHLRAAQVLPELSMQETRDADLGINPVFVASSPLILEQMAMIGVAPVNRDRPGIYGYVAEDGKHFKDRTTIDLIVPETYAGGGRRAARIAGQTNSATRALGLELALWDRNVMDISTFNEPFVTVRASVAGVAALLVAKSHKVHERLGQYESRPNRLRVKDSGDIALLMLAGPPAQIAATMATHCSTHPEIEPVVFDASRFLVEMYRDPDSLTRRHMTISLAPWFSADEVNTVVTRWIEEFTALATRLQGRQFEQLIKLPSVQ